MELNEVQGKELSRTLLDIGKLIFGVVVLGSIVSKEGLAIKLATASTGLAATILIVLWALFLLKDKGGK